MKGSEQARRKGKGREEREEKRERDAHRLDEMSYLSIYSALSNKEILRRMIGKRKQRATEMEEESE